MPIWSDPGILSREAPLNNASNSYTTNPTLPNWTICRSTHPPFPGNYKADSYKLRSMYMYHAITSLGQLTLSLVASGFNPNLVLTSSSWRLYGGTSRGGKKYASVFPWPTHFPPVTSPAWTWQGMGGASGEAGGEGGGWGDGGRENFEIREAEYGLNYREHVKTWKVRGKMKDSKS